MRRVIAFPCEGDTLMATLDAAKGTTGVVIVSGGNEIRCGPHRGMAMLAAGLAARGVPVFRFDRRGIGDSAGDNRGWESAGPDLAAAVAMFRSAQPRVVRVVGVGNCDGATTLACFGRAAGIDRVVLTNPWLRDEIDGLPPAAAIRSRYAARLRQPAAWWRLARGGVDLRKLARGFGKLARPTRPDPQVSRVLTGIRAWGDAATVILADGDASGIAFAGAAGDSVTRIERIATASHSFAGKANELAAIILREMA